MREELKNILLVVLLVIVIILGGYSFILSNDLRQSKAELSKNPEKFDYSVIDDKPLLENKFDYYTFTDSKEKTPDDLVDFIVKEYYGSSYYGEDYITACFKSALSCSIENSEFRTTTFDLNNDGDKEYIVMPWKVCDCQMRGASGNGNILIVKSINNKFELIGDLVGNGYFISKNKTNSYFDILTNSHGSASTGIETLYRLQVLSNGQETKGNYEQTFTKNYDFSRVTQEKQK